MNESTPNVQSRLVQYTMANGTEVTQRRSYAVDANNKWRQIKNMDAWAMVEDSISSYDDLRPENTINRLVPQSQDELPEGEFDGVDAENIQVHGMTVGAIGGIATGRNGVFSRLKNRVQDSYDRSMERFDLFKEGMGKKTRALGMAAAVLFAAGVSTVALENVDTTSSNDKSEEVAPDVSPEVIEKISATTTAEVNLTAEQMQARYGNEVNGDRAHNEIGFFNIDPANPEQSLENLREQLRKNPDALAFWNACLGTNAPSYEACVADSSVLAKANDMAVSYREMSLDQKATIAESIIAQFDNASFDGITLEDGVYKTVAIGGDGQFIAADNYREQDPRMNFTFEIDGKKFHVQIRSCVQITQGENVVDVPEVETPPTTVPETPTTTVPETTTTTTPTTTVPETTTTTTPTTTVPETTTTVVTLPKTPPTYPDGEVTTTVVAGPVTPIEPTTSTVPQPTTLPTSPANTSVSTTAPEVPVNTPPVNNDFVFPVFGGLGAGTFFAWLGRKNGLDNEEDEFNKKKKKA